MAGSPGAGKTEFSKQFIKYLNKKNNIRVVRIDADDIREMLPGYTGKNSDLFQVATSIGVEKLHDEVLKRHKHFILDGTLGNLAKAQENIQRSLTKCRRVVVIYLYQDPVLSWKFVRARERLEGRAIPKESFIKQLFSAKENVQTLKSIFGDDLYLWVAIKDFSNKVEELHDDVQDVDKYVTIPYTSKQLHSML